MPIGCITNSLAVALGGVLGVTLGRFLPQRVRDTLPNAFAFSAMLIGINLMIQVNSLAATILAFLCGTVLGELICLENRIAAGLRWVQLRVLRTSSMSQSQMDDLLSVLLLFCASGTGIFGALNEGMTGDSSILMAKSILDVATASIFALSLGIIVSAIAIPQLAIFLILFFSAELIVPFMTAGMMGDFRAVGGILTFITGFRLLKLKQVPVINMLPAIFLSPVFSSIL